MTERMPMTSCFGKQTFPDSTTQGMLVGWSLDGVSPENPIHYQDTIFLQRLLNSTGSHAVQSGPSKHNGAWYHYTFDQPQEPYLLQLTVKKRAAKVEMAHSCLLFYMTPSGSPISISVRHIQDVNATQTRTTMLYARGYVVSPAQCKELWGLSIAKGVLSHKFDQEEVDEDFIITTVGSEHYRLPTETNRITGKKQAVVVQIRRPRRKLIV